MPVPVARVENLRVEVGGQVLVDGVSLTVVPGRCTALVGPSGSGKSTTALALLGEYPAGARVTGTVEVAGRVGYIPQQPSAALNPARRAGALLSDIARLDGGSRADRTARVHAALRAAQLPDPAAVLRRHPHQLSGGQQQRVVLAQALLSGAPVVIADEPTTGQDALTKRRVIDELRTVLEGGVGLLLLSHDPDVVAELADDVVELGKGTAVAEPVGTPRAATRPAGPTLLRTERLTAWHGHRRGGAAVLHEAALELGAGECLAVVGRSGSGKTTLARCLAGLHRRWSGRVLLDGAELPPSVRDRGREQLAAMQYVFQDARASFDEFRPVLAQVARTAVRLRGTTAAEARAEALAALATTGLTEATAARPPAALSGGELQRAALARALLARPRLLLCDEITSGLDPAARREVCALLSRISAEGTALLVITHDREVAAALADRIAVLDQGRILESGPAATLLSTPAHPFTRALLRAGGPEVATKASTGEGTALSVSGARAAAPAPAGREPGCADPPPPAAPS